MNILPSFLVAMSLSMDNLAISLAAGCARTDEIKGGIVCRISAWFTAAHWVMFSLGFLGGHELVRWIGRTGIWAACLILTAIGVHMVAESFHSPEKVQVSVFNSIKMRMLLAFATSMDALFVGMGLGLAHAPYVITVLLMCLCVFSTSVFGFYAGGWLGSRAGVWAERFGGIILILLGVKLLL